MEPSPATESASLPEAPSVFRAVVEGALAVMMPATFQTLRRRELGLPEQRHQLPAAIVYDVGNNFITLSSFLAFGGFDGSLTAIGVAAGLKTTQLLIAESIFNPKPKT